MIRRMRIMLFITMGQGKTSQGEKVTEEVQSRSWIGHCYPTVWESDDVQT